MKGSGNNEFTDVPCCFFGSCQVRYTTYVRTHWLSRRFSSTHRRKYRDCNLNQSRRLHSFINEFKQKAVTFTLRHNNKKTRVSLQGEHVHVLGVTRQQHTYVTFPHTRSDVLPKTHIESLLNDTVIRQHLIVSAVVKDENGISVK